MAATLHAALGIPSQLETVGALAGLAAVVGLAVLSMLYFAQAREVKRLREWAGRAPERAAEIEARTTEAAQRRVVAQPQRPAVAQAATPAGQAAAAAGKTAPATAAAATASPAAAPTQGPPGNGHTGAPGAPAKPAAPATGAPGQPAATQPSTGAPAPPAPAQPAPGQPATAAPTAGPGSGSGSGQPAVPAQPAPGQPPEQPTTAQPAAKPPVPKPIPLQQTTAQPPTRPPGTAPRTAAGSAARRPAQPLRAAAPSATVPPRGRGAAAPSGSGGGGSRRSILLIVGAVVLVLAAGVFAYTQFSGGDEDPGPATQGNTIGAQQPAEKPPATGGERPARGDTVVAVLNGTTVPGLARSVADRLEGAGYQIGAVTNAPDQQRSATQVSYQPGQQRAGRDVARLIDVGSDAVAPIDEVTSATAGGEAVVVVTVGSDQSPS